jgi:hypothetical protein
MVLLENYQIDLKNTSSYCISFSGTYSFTESISLVKKSKVPRVVLTSTLTTICTVKKRM